jgi:hypothetical protein
VLRRCFAGCFVKGFLVPAEKFGSLERSFLVRDENNVGEDGKLCNSIYSVCVREVDVC